MDPQQRLLLELAWEALEDAGIPVSGPRETKTGVFVGLQWNDYFRLLSRDWRRLDGYAVIGNDLLFGANRISFSFDLPGPSVTIACGCASGLVALEQGCKALWSGEADQVVVGAADLVLAPESQLAMAATGMLSKRGACRPLDAGADGFVRGEGGVVVVLKPLSHVGPHERVHAVIRGVASAHSGRGEWIMASSRATQVSVIRAACAQGGIAPGVLDYVELHATGSLRGDPVELAALGETVGDRPCDAAPCVIGSVKAQIGHLGPAAGLAGLLKVILGLRRGQVPASRRQEAVDPALEIERGGLTLDGGGLPWHRRNGAPRRAGVTALSLGGVAAHAVLEEAPEMARPSDMRAGRDHLLPLSARSIPSLAALACAYAACLDDAPDADAVADICFTAGAGRTHHAFRLAVWGTCGPQLADRLREEAAALVQFQGRIVVVALGLDVAANAPLEVACAAANVVMVPIADHVVMDGVAPSAVTDLAAGAHVAVLIGTDRHRAADRLLTPLEAVAQTFSVFEVPGLGNIPAAFWAKLYVHGGMPNFAALGCGRIRGAPLYPWQRSRMWPEWLTAELIGTPPDQREPDNRAGNIAIHPLLGRHLDLADHADCNIWQTTGKALMRATQPPHDGVPLLRMARAALALTARPQHEPAWRVETVQPFPVMETCEVQTVLIAAQPGLPPELRVFLREAQGTWNRYAVVRVANEEAACRAGVETTEQIRGRLFRWLQTVLIRVLQPEDAATISADVAMADLGLDSIAAAEIRNFVLHDLALELPIAAVFDARTPARLNEELLRRLQAALLLDKNTAKAGQRQQEELEDQETWTL